MLLSLDSFSKTTLVVGDSVSISKEDAKLIKEDLRLGLLCDSIKGEQALRILNFQGMVQKFESKDLAHTNRVARLDKKVKTVTLQRDFFKKITLFGVPIAIGGGVVLGILIAK